MRLLWQVHMPKRALKIDWLQRWIDEVHHFQGKEFFDEVWNAQSLRTSILDEEEFH
jgi:hypothetical protein